MADLPNIRRDCLPSPDPDALFPSARSTHGARILLLYGSLRERSFSLLAAEESARVLNALGAETRILDPRGLPLADATGADDAK
ncbi:MAG: NADPH-dependent FMN reductase, partial [Paracoccus sp. (in: a-proteobacteria)]|uniref:NADPH-dependent FMN reductase n=1 Tax=Paracoccus sp. TaxID=267 RepID=UPI004058BE99